jgi:predicted ATPase
MNIAAWLRKLGPEYHGVALPLRRALHGGVARILEAHWPGLAPALPAQQQIAASLDLTAVVHWLGEGQRALERRAGAEAVAMFCKALDLLDGLPTVEESAAERAHVLAALAQALSVTEGPAAPQVEQTCDMARVLCQRVGARPALFPTVRSLWEHYNTGGQVETARALAEQCQRLVLDAQEPGLTAEADFCLGVSSLFAGHHADARERLGRSVVRSDARPRRDGATSATRDLRVTALVHLAQATWLCGYPEQALRMSQEAVESARATGKRFTLAYALLGASWVSQLGRDVAATRALAADALACATEEDLPAFAAIAGVMRGWSSIGTEPAEGLVATVGKALGDYRATGMGIARPYLLGLLADVHGARSETAPALEVLDEAAEVAGATGERWYEPEIRRREGELLLRQSITNRRVASARFCQAIAIAQQQGGKSLELRASVSLARLWADVGRRSQARDLLAPIYGWFNEGFETADLKDAGALLEELR